MLALFSQLDNEDRARGMQLWMGEKAMWAGLLLKQNKLLGLVLIRVLSEAGTLLLVNKSALVKTCFYLTNEKKTTTVMLTCVFSSQ